MAKDKEIYEGKPYKNIQGAIKISFVSGTLASASAFIFSFGELYLSVLCISVSIFMFFFAAILGPRHLFPEE